ncbi:MAG TPA: glycosyl hydrolase 115 family protein [Verrucomicrobiae bacterium]
MKFILSVASLWLLVGQWLVTAADLKLAAPTQAEGLVLWDGRQLAGLVVESNAEPAVVRAAHDLAADFERVTGHQPAWTDPAKNQTATAILIGTCGQSALLDQLVRDGKLSVTGLAGIWESYVLQVVTNPIPGVQRALVIAGSDRRGTIYGIYQLSQMIGVSPWYWWADVPVVHHDRLVLQGDRLYQASPAVAYRGIFLNDEDWGLRPWAAKTFDPATGNIGPKTYAPIFELLLRLRANCLWPAMHPGTAAFNQYPEAARLADDYGIVMGSSHCEQMLRNNVSEWDEKTFGDYNFVTNPDGVLKYWEQRLITNGKYENLYTLGMRGIHDSGMPGGGTEREKAMRLQNIITAQRTLLARHVNTNVAAVPQIFCPYKEVLPLYRLMTNLPSDITLVWPDDNYGYIRQFSNAAERQRRGGGGVYYHVSYWGAPRDYLWLCSTPPALMAEEMGKAFDYGADRVWILNVGDLKPAEWGMEYFLNLAWAPHAWQGTNTYTLLESQLVRDFGPQVGPQITPLLAEYDRLNFQRKPEHVFFPTNDLFSPVEVQGRLADWQALVAATRAVATQVPAAAQDAFFELVGYPIYAAAAQNEKCLAGSAAASDELMQLTTQYNEAVAGGKWRGMMSANPRKQVAISQAAMEAAGMRWTNAPRYKIARPQPAGRSAPGQVFTEQGHAIIMEAEAATAVLPGREASWRRVEGLGYNGAALTVLPTTAATLDTIEKIRSAAPELQFQMELQTTGDWQFTVRALPTYSPETAKPQRYAVALDDESPMIVALPLSLDEHNRTWGENVLRNAALTCSRHMVKTPGRHVLKLWMVDPGLVLDAVRGETDGAAPTGYNWVP